MILQRGRSKRHVSCSCKCCIAERETPIPRYFFKEHCYAFDEVTLFIEFYVVGIRLYINVLSESPPFLERLSELASDHAHYFSLNDDEQTHYMAMVARWVSLNKHKTTHSLRAVGTHE
jgi:hypothetical protein